MTPSDLRLCRSVLFLPASNPRAIEKARELEADVIILDLEDAVRPEDKGTASYKPVPFMMSTRGYGLWVASTAPGQFDLNATDREHIKIEYPAGKLRVRGASSA